MRLFQTFTSPMCARIRLAIYRKNLNVELSLPPAAGVKSAAFLALSPIGKIPVLELGSGAVLAESSLILEFLEDKFPEVPMLPDSPEERARANLISRLVDTYVFPPIVALHLQTKVEQRDDKLIAGAVEKLKAALGYAEHWMDGDGVAVQWGYSLADCALAPLLVTLERVTGSLGLPDLLAGLRLQEYWRTIQKDGTTARVIDEMKQARQAAR